MVRQMAWGRLALVAGLVLSLSAATRVQGQSTSSGMFGSRTLGSSISGNGSNLSSSGTAGSRLEQQSSVGQISGSERFLRDSRQAGQFVGSDSGESNFIGATSAGGSSMSSMGGRSMGMYGSSGMLGMSSRYGSMNQRGMSQYGNQRGMNQFGMGNFGLMGGMRRNVNLQTQMKVDFKYAPLEGVQVQTALARRVNTTPRIQKSGQLEIVVVGRTATLRGVVATEDDRTLAVRMVRLEPGITEVRDELSVAASEPVPPQPLDR